jgi:biopolymer transport protein TolR
MSKRNSTDSTDLDLVPIMNLVTILIPFLLMASTFAAIAVIDSTLPAIVDNSDAPPPKKEAITQPSVIISATGFRVDGLDKPTVLTCARLPCEDFPYAELTETLLGMRDAGPATDAVILVPDSQIPYEVLIQTMDAARGADFPGVVIAGGVG